MTEGERQAFEVLWEQFYNYFNAMRVYDNHFCDEVCPLCDTCQANYRQDECIDRFIKYYADEGG